MLVRDKYLPKIIHTADFNKHVLTEYKRPALESKRPYIDLNNPLHDGGLLNVMMFDVDAGNAPLAWHDSIPFQPAYFTGTWKDDVLERPHAVIYLRIPVKKTSRKQVRLFQAVYDEIANRLRAEGCKVDPGQKPTSKNPDSGAWDVVRGDAKEWTLYELAEALGLDSEAAENPTVIPFISSGASESEYAALGRNCEIFEAVRYAAYAYKSRCTGYEDLYRFVYHECEQHNNSFSPALAICEIRSLAKSIARWTWYRYTGSNKNKGAAAHLITPVMSTKKRQSIGALYTASIKVESTAREIYEAKKELAGAHKAITKKAVARETGISLKTVKKHWNGYESPATEAVEKLAAGVSIITASDIRRFGLKGGVIRSHQKTMA